MEVKVVQIDAKKLWMSNQEAQKYLGMGADFFRKLRENGTLHFSKVSNTIFYMKSEIDGLIRKGAVTGVQLFKAT